MNKEEQDKLDLSRYKGLGLLHQIKNPSPYKGLTIDKLKETLNEFFNEKDPDPMNDRIRESQMQDSIRMMSAAEVLERYPREDMIRYLGVDIVKGLEKKRDLDVVRKMLEE